MSADGGLEAGHLEFHRVMNLRLWIEVEGDGLVAGERDVHEPGLVHDHAIGFDDEAWRASAFTHSLRGEFRSGSDWDDFLHEILELRSLANFSVEIMIGEIAVSSNVYSKFSFVSVFSNDFSENFELELEFRYRFHRGFPFVVDAYIIPHSP